MKNISIHIANVRVVLPDRVLNNSSVTFANGTITAVGGTPEKGAEIIDAGCKCMLSG